MEDKEGKKREEGERERERNSREKSITNHPTTQTPTLANGHILYEFIFHRSHSSILLSNHCSIKQKCTEFLYLKDVFYTVWNTDIRPKSFKEFIGIVLAST